MCNLHYHHGGSEQSRGTTILIRWDSNYSFCDGEYLVSLPQWDWGRLYNKILGIVTPEKLFENDYHLLLTKPNLDW